MHENWDPANNYSDYPVSVAEIKASKSDRADAWTPREALLDTLRRIDRGELKIDQMIICMRTSTAADANSPGQGETSYTAAGCSDMAQEIGIVALVQHMRITGM